MNMMDVMKKVKDALLERVSLTQKVIASIHAHASVAYKSKSDAAGPVPMTKRFSTYYCDDWSLFVEWNKEHEGEIVSETERIRIIYSKRVLPETYLSIAHIRWQ
jgi:hypothetical protein